MVPGTICYPGTGPPRRSTRYVLGVVADDKRIDKAQRPFWLHQGAEYVLGLMLVAGGVQNPEPFFPVLAGGLIVVNAAIVTGPLGAWRAVGRPLHRWLDVGVMAAIALAAVLPFLEIDNASRLMMLGVVAVMALMWATTNFRNPGPRVRPAGAPVDRSESIGRAAGRLVNQGRAFARKRRDG